MSRSSHSIAGGARTLSPAALLALGGLLAACSDQLPSSPAVPRNSPQTPAGIVIPDLLPKQILFGALTNAGPQIYRINPNGTSQVQVTQGLGGSLPSWSPDRTKIVFSRAIGGVLTLMVMTVDGSWNSTHGAGYFARWSPDGTKIAFQRHVNGGVPQVFVMNADGSGVQQLTSHPFGGYVPGWSPDSKKIVYAAAPDGGSGGQSEIWVMNANGVNPHQVTSCTSNGMKCSGADWHPDAGDNRIVYSVSPYGSSLSQIRTIRANGSDDTFIRSVPNFTPNKFPVWSPDGTKIAYLAMASTYVYPEIFIMNANGTSPQRVTFMNFEKQGFDW